MDGRAGVFDALLRQQQWQPVQHPKRQEGLTDPTALGVCGVWVQPGEIGCFAQFEHLGGVVLNRWRMDVFASWGRRPTLGSGMVLPSTQLLPYTGERGHASSLEPVPELSTFNARAGEETKRRGDAVRTQYSVHTHTCARVCWPWQLALLRSVQIRSGLGLVGPGDREPNRAQGRREPPG